MKNRIHTEGLHDHVGEEVTLAGWVHNTRDHGKVTFVDLRDKTSVVQLVSKEGNDAHETVDNLRREWVVKVTGEVSERPDSMVNEDEEMGGLEVEITDISVLNEANTPPFELDEGTSDVDENRRMEHRYLDLRSMRMQDNIRKRHEVVKFFRDYLDERGFIEVETPILGKSTPEGARDYLVPSRKHAGQFYALPQSPQQYKQLLMNSGIDRYFQVARAFRDEDTRKDRQPEHTQLDMEMSFTDPEEVMGLIESMVNEMMEQVFPDKKVKKPWPRISYQEAMDEYGNDKPDLRDNPDDPDEIAFGWVVDFPQFEEDEDTGLLTPVHHMFVQPEEDSIDLLDDNPLEMVSTQYDWICNGFELASGSMRISDTDLQRKVMKTIGLDDEEIEKKFGHILKAFEYGVPPHGGIAPGIDRLIMILQNEPSIREVMAFPKTGDGRDLLMDAPSDVDQNQLHELGLEVTEEDKEA